jgi:hypothetical protein
VSIGTAPPSSATPRKLSSAWAIFASHKSTHNPLPHARTEYGVTEGLAILEAVGVLLQSVAAPLQATQTSDSHLGYHQYLHPPQPLPLRHLPAIPLLQPPGHPSYTYPLLYSLYIPPMTPPPGLVTPTLQAFFTSPTTPLVSWAIVWRVACTIFHVRSPRASNIRFGCG